MLTHENAVRAKCHLCNQSVSYKTSTTNLKRHFEQKNPLVQINNYDTEICKTKKSSEPVRTLLTETEIELSVPTFKPTYERCDKKQTSTVH